MIHRPMFLAKLIEGLKKRFFLVKGSDGQEEIARQYTAFNAVSVSSMTSRYREGESAQLVWEDIRALRNKVKPNLINWDNILLELKKVFQQTDKDVGESLDSNDYPNISRLQQLVRVQSPTSAECERLFSRMNIIHTDLRNRLSLMSVRNLILMNEVASHPYLYDPRADAEVLLQTKPRARKRKVRDLRMTPAAKASFDLTKAVNGK
jgi:hypothetical protein